MIREIRKRWEGEGVSREGVGSDPMLSIFAVFSVLLYSTGHLCLSNISFVYAME